MKTFFYLFNKNMTISAQEKNMYIFDLSYLSDYFQFKWDFIINLSDVNNTMYIFIENKNEIQTDTWKPISF